MYQELNAIVLPGGTMHMERTDTGEQICKSSHLLQQEIYRRFTSDPETALLFLGFCDRTVPLSASLSFWREITGLFATKVRLTQDIETVRHRIKIAVELIYPCKFNYVFMYGKVTILFIKNQDTGLIEMVI